MIAFACAYLLLLLLIGVWSLRRTRGPRDYFLAGKRLGLATAALATLASIMSGFLFVGGPGLFYRVGLASFWITISSSFTGAMMCWLLARPLERLSRQGCLTLPDLIQHRFGCRLSSALAALAILVGVIGYLGTQLQALGVILAAMLGIDPGGALWLGLGVLVFYSVAGGMVAGVWTDVVQGIVMVVATTLLFFFALHAAGGLEEISRSFLERAPELIRPWGRSDAQLALSWFFLFAVGALGQPHVVHKLMMVRDVKVLRFFPLVLASTMILAGLIWLGAGLAVRSMVLRGLMAPLENPDQTVTRLLAGAVPRWLAALVYAGVLSAIMSTADSFVNVGAAALSRDLPAALGRRALTGLRWGRLSALLLFALSLALSWWMKSLVAYLGIFGFGVLAATLTPVLVLGLNWEGAGPWAARSSIGVGLVLSLALEVLVRVGGWSFSFAPGALALAVSLLVFLGVGRWEQSRAGRKSAALASTGPSGVP